MSSRRSTESYYNLPTFDRLPRPLTPWTKCLLPPTAFWLAEGIALFAGISRSRGGAPLHVLLQQAEARLKCPWILLGIFCLWTHALIRESSVHESFFFVWSKWSRKGQLLVELHISQD
jgi:hypothetical protein